jgi:hypothetical protein
MKLFIVPFQENCFNEYELSISKAALLNKDYY